MATAVNSVIPGLPRGASTYPNARNSSHVLTEKDGVIHKSTLALPLPMKAPILHSETYSRKVFVGGLPPDIDQGFIFYNIYIFASFVILMASS